MSQALARRAFEAKDISHWENGQHSCPSLTSPTFINNSIIPPLNVNLFGEHSPAHQPLSHNKLSLIVALPLQLILLVGEVVRIERRLQAAAVWLRNIGA